MDTKGNDKDLAIIQTFGNKLRFRVSGILIEGDAVLLVAHKNLKSDVAFWAPPGGGMTYGEDAIACLKREFKEETHLEVEVGRLLFVNEYLEPPLHAIELFFEIKSYKGTLQLGHDPELKAGQQILEDLKFVPFSDIKNGVGGRYHAIFEKVDGVAALKNLTGYHKNILRA